MINHCRHRFANIPTARFATGDAEDATFLPSHIETIASSCVAQWFADPASTWRLAVIASGAGRCYGDRRAVTWLV